MNTSQLQCMIECDPILRDNVVGVYAADQLPVKTMQRPYGFIANTDIHLMQGHHWCAFFHDGYDLEFFDSYGRSPERNSVYFKQWLNKRSSSVRVNKHQIQSDSSSVCGLYCILYLRNRLLGQTMTDFIDHFDSSNFNNNDTFVYNITSKAYSQCVKTYEHFNQTCCSLA